MPRQGSSSRISRRFWTSTTDARNWVRDLPPTRARVSQRSKPESCIIWGRSHGTTQLISQRRPEQTPVSRGAARQAVGPEPKRKRLSRDPLGDKCTCDANYSSGSTDASAIREIEARLWRYPAARADGEAGRGGTEITGIDLGRAVAWSSSSMWDSNYWVAGPPSGSHYGHWGVVRRGLLQVTAVAPTKPRRCNRPDHGT